MSDRVDEWMADVMSQDRPSIHSASESPRPCLYSPSGPHPASGPSFHSEFGTCNNFKIIFSFHYFVFYATVDGRIDSMSTIIRGRIVLG